MTAWMWFFVIIGASLAVFAMMWGEAAIAFYRKFHGKRLITCPETHEHEAVQVAAVAGACGALFHPTEMKLRTCTRWPERQDCGQECLGQIAAAPADCLVTNIVNKWYADKQCVYCRRPFDAISWAERPPALLDTHGKTVLWPEVNVEQLVETLAASSPVCWNCHVAETFRREHTDLVTDRDFDKHRPAA